VDLRLIDAEPTEAERAAIDAVLGATNGASEHRVDRRALRLGRLRVDQTQVH